MNGKETTIPLIHLLWYGDQIHPNGAFSLFLPFFSHCLPGYQASSSLALLADTAYLYTANDVRLTLFKGGTAHRPLSYLLWAQFARP